MEIVRGVYCLSGQLPKSEAFGLKLQMTRAAISIPSNIAEGSAKSGRQDYKRYLEIALGSGYELETQVIICDMLSYGELQVRQALLKHIDEEQKMLRSFIEKIK